MTKPASQPAADPALSRILAAIRELDLAFATIGMSTPVAIVLAAPDRTRLEAMMTEEYRERLYRTVLVEPGRFTFRNIEIREDQPRSTNTAS